MTSPGQHIVPGGYVAFTDGWVKNIRGAALTERRVNEYLQLSGMRCERQLNKGRRFHEEGYVRNIMYNEVSPRSEVGVLRSICLPSMKGGYYLVHAALSKDTGAVTGAHCLCAAG
ncbi:hypothetical protein HPB52_009414 [Rhipicephalus sanguineus]|uniref:Uncharacterized protein n=1 Tax=Rhipicephalus sanguineus TaxID=34632 RepID=A0A9D4PTK0_RHISA|nr:hypothetical protein HPB52_009414 [Rhipicephalus sanguineus]